MNCSKVSVWICSANATIYYPTEKRKEIVFDRENVSHYVRSLSWPKSWWLEGLKLSKEKNDVPKNGRVSRFPRETNIFVLSTFSQANREN